MFNATSWYPYPTLTRREPCAVPVHDLALKEALVLLPSGSVQSVSWQSMALSGRALEGPVTAELLAIWPIRLVALTKCTVRPLNFRCGLFHPPLSCKRTPPRDINYLSWDDNSVIILQYLKRMRPTVSFHGHIPLQVRPLSPADMGSAATEI